MVEATRADEHECPRRGPGVDRRAGARLRSRRCGRGTSRGTSRGSTSTAVPRASSASGCFPNQAPGDDLVLRAPGRRMVRHRGEPVALRGLRPRRRMAYDRWRACGSRWRPGTPSATFRLEGVVRTVTGPDAGGFVPLSVDAARRRRPPTVRHRHRQRPGERRSTRRAGSSSRSAVSGTVTAGGPAQPVRAAGHRDRSWGPRNWRVTFTLGDLQAEHAQLYFVGAPQLARARRWLPARRVRRAGPRDASAARSSTTTRRARSRRARCASTTGDGA